MVLDYFLINHPLNVYHVPHILVQLNVSIASTYIVHVHVNCTQESPYYSHRWPGPRVTSINCSIHTCTYDPKESICSCVGEDS